jgi:hypothetical protein
MRKIDALMMMINDNRVFRTYGTVPVLVCAKNSLTDLFSTRISTTSTVLVLYR